MSSPFSRSLRSLAADSGGESRLAILIATLLLGLWLVWFLKARVVVYEVTESARIEVSRVAHVVDAPITGTVAAAHLELSRDVESDSVLVELDSRAAELELAERQARLAALEAEIEPLLSQVTAAETNLLAYEDVGLAQLGEARARKLESSERVELAATEAERAEQLLHEGLLSAAELDRAESEKRALEAVDAATAQTVDRVEAEGRGRRVDLEGEVARLKRELAKLRGDRAIEAEAISRLLFELESHKIRAPVAGVLGEITTVQPGTVLRQGDQIAVIVPPGGLHLVATFDAATAAGRVLPGQPGRLRLSSFPWQQYGTLPVAVVSVGSQEQNGLMRVELRLEPDGGSVIPVQHGLTGTVEVEVERVPPAILVLRAAGRLVSGEERGLEIGSEAP